MNEDESATSRPPDTQAPLTAQITGLVIDRNALPGLTANCASKAFHLRAKLPVEASLKSTPAVKTGSTAVTMTARMSEACSASESNAQNRSRIAIDMAFLASGRLKVIVRIPSSSTQGS